MPHFNKWFDRVPSGATVQAALQKLWQQRCQAVTFYLLRLKKEKSPRVDTVHQLRVWARRTAAVVDLFGPASAEGPWKKLRKHLKKVRRLAGEVRDYDVLWEEIRKSKGVDADFKATWKRRRRLARLRLKQAAHSKSSLKDGPKRLKEEAQAVLAMREPGRKRPFAELAVEKLKGSVQEWQKQGRADMQQPAELHEFRIEGKRLRYALEITGGVFPKKQVAKIYQDLNELHNRLGKICDSRAAIERFEAMYEEAPAGIRKTLAKLIRHERKQLATGQRAFLKHWTVAVRKEWGKRFRELLK